MKLPNYRVKMLFQYDKWLTVALDTAKKADLDTKTIEVLLIANRCRLSAVRSKSYLRFNKDRD